MTRLPDRFDLWVRKARECHDPARQVDYVLGALAGLKEWHFLNSGMRGSPQPAETEIEGFSYLLVFSDAGRIEELFHKKGHHRADDPLPIITMPTDEAMAWCLQRQSLGYAGMLVNPGEDAFTFFMKELADFYEEWSKRGGRQASGFWIPNMTTEEEDFWQEQGL